MIKAKHDEWNKNMEQLLTLNTINEVKKKKQTKYLQPIT